MRFLPFFQRWIYLHSFVFPISKITRKKIESILFPIQHLVLPTLEWNTQIFFEVSVKFLMHYIPKLYNNIILYRQHFTLEFVILKIDLVGKSRKINCFTIFACNIISRKTSWYWFYLIFIKEEIIWLQRCCLFTYNAW